MRGLGDLLPGPLFLFFLEACLQESLVDDAAPRARHKERNLKRATDRSRAANNQHARMVGQLRVLSSRIEASGGQRRQEQLADAKHKDRINAVRQVTTSGIHIALEELNHKSWQRSFYGKHTLITSPGDSTNRLMRDAEMLGGSVYLAGLVD